MRAPNRVCCRWGGAHTFFALFLPLSVSCILDQSSICGQILVSFWLFFLGCGATRSARRAESGAEHVVHVVQKQMEGGVSLAQPKAEPEMFLRGFSPVWWVLGQRVGALGGFSKK